MILKWIRFVLLLVTSVSDTIPLQFVTHPEANLNIVQKIRRQGYPVEIHKVVTQDNYILTTHRIPYGKNGTNNATKRSPVLLAHGMGASSEYFLALGADHALAYYLADRGFDVWLLNFRATSYSRKHKYYDLNKDNKYWKFSFHEIAVHDLPANIDYIVNKTNQKVFIIGHSQGNTCYFIMTSEKPKYNEKIKISVAYGPAASLKHIDYPLAIFFSYLVDIIQAVLKFFNIYDVPFYDIFAQLFTIICSERTYFMQVCINILSVIGSHESKLTDKDVAALVFSIPPARIALMQLIHYMQLIKSGIFRQYDFGVTGNLKKYKSSTPPEYDIRKSVAPAALFYAEKDDVSSIKGTNELFNTLPNVIYSHKVQYKYFNHVDFLFGNNASTLVYQPTSQLFKDFDEGNLQLNVRKRPKT